MTDLTGVPETALWTLRNRAEEALRPDTYYHDPESVRLYRLLDADLARFGEPSQSHPLRALAFDAVAHEFLAEHPGGPVVALGEGLQTSYWRLGRPDASWFSVDVPEMVAAQQQVLPKEPAITRIAASALDRSWLDAVPEGPALVTAEGLFMYLPKDDVHSLIADLAARFRGGQLVYDSIPRWFSALTLKGKVRLTDRYVAPSMPTSQTTSEARQLPAVIPGVVSSRDILVPRGRGPWASALMRTLSNAPGVRNIRPSITLLDFAE